MKIKSYNKSYQVEIVDKLDLQLIIKDTKHLLVVDRKVFIIYKDFIFKNINPDDIILLDAEENKKTIETALEICRRMADISFKRSDTLISIGGGIIQDISGFAANIYNRGIKWTFIPTTLLAQCDSCIGGKTSLNFLDYKNILGSFYAPDTIFIHLNFVSTLTTDDYLSGLGEVAKFNIMAAVDGIELLEKNIDKLLTRDVSTLHFFLERSLEFKKRFIEEDEFDRGVRNLLNFAHTFGHAFETVSHYAIPHGQAVTLGLIIANIISCNRNILGAALKKRIEELCVQLLSVQLDSDWFSSEQITGAMKKDKKRTTNNLTAVLFKTDLSLEVVHDLQAIEVEKGLKELTQLLLLKGKIANI